MAVQSSSNPLIHVEEAHANPSITISIFILPLSKPSHTHHHLFSFYTTLSIPIFLSFLIPIKHSSRHLSLSKPSHIHHYLFSLYTTTIPISYTSMHTLTPPTRSPFLPHAWLSKAPPIHPSMCMGLMQTISSPHPSSLFSYSHALNAHMSFLSLPVVHFTHDLYIHDLYTPCWCRTSTTATVPTENGDRTNSKRLLPFSCKKMPGPTVWTHHSKFKLVSFLID